MTNNIFNYKRFTLVCKKDWAENWKKNLIYFLSIFIALLFFSLWYTNDEYTSAIEYGVNLDNISSYTNRNLLIFGYIAFMFSSFNYTSTLMNPINSKPKLINHFMNPGSLLEKFLCRTLQVTIGYTLLFIACVWLVDIIRVEIFTLKFPNLDVVHLSFNKLYNSHNSISEHQAYNGSYAFANVRNFLIACFSFLILQSLFALGSTFWRKGVVFKSYCAISLLVFLYIYLSNIIFDSLKDSDTNEIFYYINHANDYIAIGIALVFCLLNWVLTFYRFKESEINPKW